MDQNRKILLTILVFMTVSLVLAVYSAGAGARKDKSSAELLSAPNSAPCVGLVRIYGTIAVTSEESLFGEGGGSDQIVALLDGFLNDENVKAVVIRIDSPGGTVGATQEIYRKIMQLRSKNIPVVASMGDVAASGGYYIASACNYIFANQGTLTGSIGVIMSSPDLTGLMEKAGIKMNVIKSGTHKDILSSTRAITEEESKLLQELIDSTYGQFLKDVSLGRNLPISDFEQYADGRVLTGEQALQVRLIDEIGSYENAIAKAKLLAGLPENAGVYENEQSPFEKILGSMGVAFNGMSRVEKKVTAAIRPYTRLEYRYIQ